MTSYSASQLHVVERNCPYALDLYEQGVPQDRRIFAAGTAAHAVFERVCEETSKLGRDLDQKEMESVADEVTGALIANGRTYNGRQEPPLPFDRALEGRRLALEYLGLWWPKPSASSELGLAVDEHWHPVPYDSEQAWLRGVLDYASIETVTDEENGEVLALIVSDFKSSWVAGEPDLDSIQRKVHTVLAALCLGRPEIGLIRVQIQNVRTWRTHSRDFWQPFGESGEIISQDLLDWQREVAIVLGALDEQKRLGRRPPAPGVNCLRCPYILRCEFAQDYMERRGMHHTPEKRAEAYAVALATLEELELDVRADCESGDQKFSIPAPGGVVGWREKEQRELAESAYAEIAGAWTDQGGDVRGLVAAIQPSVTAAERVARKLFPERGQKLEREAWLEPLIETKRVKRFGAHRAVEGDEA